MKIIQSSNYSNYLKSNPKTKFQMLKQIFNHLIFKFHLE